MTLAYVFWHRPAPGVDPVAYEAALDRFHRALAAPGGSCALALDDAPWLPGDGPAYEDWYLVPHWAALGELNRDAVTGPRATPHDAAARHAGTGAAGVYALVAGAAEPPAHGWHAWLDKPRGVPYPDFHAALPEQAWQRQMTLGPAPEYVVSAPAPLELPWPAAAQSTRPSASRCALVTASLARAAASAASS